MRRLLTSLVALSALAAGFATGPAAAADDGEWLHATSLVDKPRYPPDFTHFNYVNPDAPKGGVVRMSGSSPTFDTLNPILPKGVPADGTGLMYESLMMRAFDELDISGQYPQVAEAVRFPADFSSVTYRLNPAAKWHDGQPITPEDVVWSFNELVDLNPSQRFYYQHVTKAEVTGDHEVTFTFDQTGNRELPQIVGEFPILPKHWWEGTDKNGNKRDISRGTLEPPLGSGPYEIASVSPGRSITYKRVPDFWGTDLNTYVGQNNFDQISYEYFRDLDVEFQAFKADRLDYWSENEAKRWATAYDIPAVKDGRMQKDLVNLEQVSGVMVGFVPNLRRPLFQDPRVRQALNYAFDFESLNRTIFYGQYERINSFFYGLPLAWSGLPQGKELEILDSVRDKVPPEVFTKEYENPVGGDPQKVRDNLRKAVELFQEAGYHLQGTKMLDPSGKPVTFEILLNGPTIERVAVPFTQALKRIGIDATVRSVELHTVRHPRPLARLRHDLCRLGRIELARQRAARLLGLGRRGQGVVAELCRHQGPGGRCDHQPDHLRQGPRGPGGGSEGARSRHDVGSVRDPDLHDPGGAYRLLEPFRPPRRLRQVRHRLPDDLVVGRGEGRQDRRRPVTGRPAGLTRRRALQLAGATVAYGMMEPWAWAAGKTGLYGLSIFGDLKYPAGFAHFDYINPDAPKAGQMNFQPPNWIYNQSAQTFNTLNSFVLRGDAPPRMELTFDTLMTSAGDEPDSVYGLVAETVDVSDDRNVFTFHLRDTPHFRDGSPLTADDVAFSLMLLKEKGHPQISQVIGPMSKAEATDGSTVVVTLDGTQNRATILTIVGLPIFSKAYYTDNPFDSSTLSVPLGSGPYKVGNISAGRFIEYQRDAGYWGKDLPVNIGFSNFNVIRIDFYQERQVAFEAFKKGDITFREEFTAKTWAQEYNFPAVADGRVVKTTFPGEAAPSLQGFFFNTRRAKFADPRTCLAIALAFDFEWSNRNLFFDAYTREYSYFQSSDFMAEGKPGPDELALLEPYRADLPAEVFDEPAYVPPKTDGSGGDRSMLKRAADLLAEAGWRQANGRLVNEAGQVLAIEFLIDASIFERVISPFSQNLRQIGVQATIRQVDPAQYQSRLNNYDYDNILVAFRFSATPLDGLQPIFGSRAADTPGTQNYAGIKNKAVDGLLAGLPGVTGRGQLVTLLKSLDRVLRAGQYWIPSWYLDEHRVAHWNMFGWPATKPDYAFTPETTWWFDRDKAAAIGKA